MHQGETGPNSSSSPGSLIRQHRRAAGITQRQLATAAQVSIGAIRDLEQGLTLRPNASSARRLARTLGVSPGNLTLAAGGHGSDRRESTAPGRPRGAGKLRPWRLELRILGPLTAARDGVNIPLRPARQRTVLGMLATSPSQVVSRSQLEDALWGDAPPRNAATMIHSYVSSLRRNLDPGHQARARDGIVASAGSGYQLNTADIELDLDIFHRLLTDARAAREAGELSLSCKAYTQALGLWRGDPLADIQSLSCHPAVTALARLRDRTVIEYAETSQALGRHDGPLHHLELLAEREPFNERALACYMIALAGSGQHAAALQTFQQIRRRLSTDLGLPPGPELRAAHASVLQQQVQVTSSAPWFDCAPTRAPALPGARPAPPPMRSR